MMTASVGVIATDIQAEIKAKALALTLNLPYLTAVLPLPDYVLQVNQTGLALQKTGSRMQPLILDFASPAFKYRVKTTGYKNPLIKAVGLTVSHKPHILDLSAGLGRDGFILATLGAKVELIERNKVMAALLEDALSRASQDPLLAPITKRVTLIQADSQTYLAKLSDQNNFDTIYFDPMFPHRQKSALVKKEMQVLQDLLGFDTDADLLFPWACAKAQKRVVIKRPSGADFLAQQKPDFSICSPGLRFDVYMTLNKR